MKEDICEYYPNGELKHKIEYHPNGCKSCERYYDQDGKDHRDSYLPDYQTWYENGIPFIISFFVHGLEHNLNNPSWFEFSVNYKIVNKDYAINDINYSKLKWTNQIKNI
jgi:antitoxin component YwqK of YwqJK toxin-antitoxin module